jgi:hypothetical protein
VIKEKSFAVSDAGVADQQLVTSLTAEEIDRHKTDI